MDSIELLAKEEEYKKLNKQLEKKTISLMKEIESAMNKPDVFSEFQGNLLVTPKVDKKHCCTPPKLTPEATPKKTYKKTTVTKDIKENEKKITNYKETGPTFEFNIKDPYILDVGFLDTFINANVNEEILPESFLKQGTSVEDVCKFLASKIRIQQQQIDTLQATLHKKTSQCDGHLSQIADYESDRLKLLNNCNNLKSSAADSKAKAMALQKRFDEKDRLFKEQRAQLDNATGEVKRLRLKNASIEARCVSYEKENGNLKEQIELVKETERELRSSARMLSGSHTAVIAKLESKIKCLTTALSRHRELIENLRQQNCILTSEIKVKGLEKEYCEFLSRN